MPISRESRTSLIVLVILVVLAWVPQVYWTLQSGERIVSQNILYEDAFYYFQTARNVALGNGSESSGGILHNGYHPLWMLACTPFFKIASPDPYLPLRGIMLLGTLSGTVAVLLAYAVMRKLGIGQTASLIATGCYAWNPWMLSYGTSGMEAPLNGALLAALLLCALRHPGAVDSRRTRMGWSLGLGILAALVFLVRTDNAFFLLFTALFLLARNRRTWRREWPWLFLSGLVCIAVVTPWLLWNRATFGSFVQGSASALPVVREVAFFDTHPGASPADFTRYRFGLFLGWFPAILVYSGLGSVFSLLFVVVLAVLPTRSGRRDIRRLGLALYELLPLIIGIVCLGFAHKFVRLAAREWYYAAPNLTVAILVAVFLHFLSHAIPSRNVRITGAVIFVGMALGMFGVKAFGLEWIGRSKTGLWSQCPRAYALDIVDAIRTLPIADTREPVGATDSGTVGYLSPRPVINLDGVANPGAREAVLRGQLGKYIESQGIRYCLITPRMFVPRIIGAEYMNRLIPYPALTPEGYELKSNVR
jgi:hypothetical protein